MIKKNNKSKKMKARIEKLVSIIVAFILGLSFLRGITFFLLVTSAIILFMQNLFSSSALTKFGISLNNEISKKINDLRYRLENLALSFIIFKILILINWINKLISCIVAAILSIINSYLLPLGYIGIKLYELPLLLVIVYAIFRLLELIENNIFCLIKNYGK